ncbi:NADPH-dependent FMN reductase [Saccharicrinis sp. FJH62]|uniref:NADPH-dependent FMN reductase n=1 Tax=Saccharicrinis sp. FJH62 TaxID=3344657 RepID=UPI0035D49D92
MTKVISIIIGSVRPGNYTSKVVKVLVDEIRKTKDLTVNIINPVDYELPFPGMNNHSEDVSRLRHLVADSTGVILATPEYHGSFSSVIKLIIENLGYPSVLSGKPIALLGVASGEIGAVKSLESLRGVCSHVGGIILPGPISVAHVKDKFDANGNCTDLKTETRLRKLVQAMDAYFNDSICPKFYMEEMVRDQENLIV